MKPRSEQEATTSTTAPKASDVAPTPPAQPRDGDHVGGTKAGYPVEGDPAAQGDHVGGTKAGGSLPVFSE